MSRPRYRFSPSLLQKWSDYVDSEALWQTFYGNSDEPSVSLEEFEARQEDELWDAINRVDHGPIEAASRGTALNEIVDMKVEGRKVPKEGMRLDLMSDEQGFLVGLRAGLDGFVFDFDIDLVKRLTDYFEGSICQYRCEATIDTAFGPVIVYGDADYIRRDKVYDLKSTGRYDYGKFEKGWQKDVYPYALIESGMLDSVSEFEYAVVKLSIPKNGLISGEIFRERYDYSHEGAKSRLRAVCEALAAYLEMNAERIVHPSRVLNEK